MRADQNIILYGTSEEPASLRSVQLGPLSFIYTSEAIRRISWYGTELIRAFTWPIRDESWGTYPPVIIEEKILEDGELFTGSLTFTVGDGRLMCEVKIAASHDGTLSLEMVMTPSGGPFATNRAGFTVLHPIKGIAGAPLRVQHSGGNVEETEFPKLISPGQPVFDIQGMTYGLAGKTVEIVFDGEVFEMEDQRNWSDASYKTYCVPLVFPFTYNIDTSVTQSIQVSLTGGPEGAEATASDQSVAFEVSDAAAPDIGLAVEDGWLEHADLIEETGVGHLRVRVGSDANNSYLARIAAAAQGLDLDLEVVIADGDDPETALAQVQNKLTSQGLHPSRVIALRSGYLGSHQPSGPWPEGPKPAEVVEASRKAFPGVSIGGGMLTNFTEMNRCRPNPDLCDFVTHGNTAIVHAGDDLSVTETLEALPQIFESALSLANGKPYRLGLMSIGMRSNPYGAAVADNPMQVRRTMAREDPRHRGLFAAAWAVGVLAATADNAVDSLCLSAPTGPFGVAYHKQDYRQVYFDETKGAVVYPIFHVVKAAAEMAGQPRLNISGLPEGIYAYGTQTSNGCRIVLANVTPFKTVIDLGQTGQMTRLDSASFDAATSHANWLESETRLNVKKRISLEGFSVAFWET